MSNIILYTTNCPKCKVIEKKLNSKNIKYEICENIDEVLKLGFMSAPILKIDDKYMEFGEAVKWINNLNNKE